MKYPDMKENPSSLRLLYRLIGKKINKKIGPITNVQTEKPHIAITFDDGPDSVTTPILIKLFKQYRAHATFFMVGQKARKIKSLVNEMADDGHEIGNHTMDHISMTSIGRRGRWKQIQDCKKVLSPYGKRYFRPPHGEHTAWTNIDAFLQGYQVIGWDLDVGDWCNSEFSSMADELREKITKGSIILFHDTIYDKGNPKHKIIKENVNLSRDVMVDLVRLLLEEYSGQFQFVTIAEMLKHGRARRGEIRVPNVYSSGRKMI
ncbi:MAG: polysaccharide deacetylase family protein [Nitrospirae bacterium]|nr:polysaccharide deacetylase family protein [Nitrospirota bacterium]